MSWPQLGDFGMVKCSDGEWRRACARKRWVDSSPVWVFEDGLLRDVETSEARPLVVIDPEDRKQVERLEGLLWGIAYDEWTAQTDLRVALREFAKPTPPKPEEPTDLSVRVHAEGTTWAKIASWWVPVAQDECPRDWTWLVERPDFCVLPEGVA